jgi:hypothetical protein
MTNVTTGLYPTSQSAGVVNYATGSYTGDGTAGDMTVAIGFTPRYVKLMNITDILFYEYWEGAAQAVGDSAVDVWLMTGSTGVVTKDTTGAIVTNAVLKSPTEVAVNAPGSSSADDGTSGTVTVNYFTYDHTLPNLKFHAGSSGALSNVSGKVYVWQAFG